MEHSKFVQSALKILATRKGDYACTDQRGRPTTMRAAWTVAQLQLWEREQGKAATGIDTMVHWQSYTGL